MRDTKHGLVIYNAAAGAGKTYTLVKDYIILLLQTPANDGYKYILAITFTNKAVAEMKTRVLHTLVDLSKMSIKEKENNNSLISAIRSETGLSFDYIKQKADKIVKSILHNYASFDIVTIDTFTHRVLRTFSKDLGISSNFEIEMDVDLLIHEAVDRVVDKIGVEPELTNAIIEFALTKLDEDKSWDVSIELRNIGDLLKSEQQRKSLLKIEDKSLKDFKVLDVNLKTKIGQIKENIKKLATEIIAVFELNSLKEADFMRGSIPKHFKKLIGGDTRFDTTTGWKQNITGAAFYSKATSKDTKETIDRLRPKIEEAFAQTQDLLANLEFYVNVKKNLIPLSILKTIHRELNLIKKERNLVLISEFNTTITDTIKDQPAPFIYERLGEKYRDYFIDEFQDTSVLQWQNLVPLIDNAVSTEDSNGKKGRVTLVGDVKQAIYRWRGGDAEQFINLSTAANPFANPTKEVANLPKNYRSYSEIINFNNKFFSGLANDFMNLEYKRLYKEGNQQEYNQKKGGFISIQFIEANSIEEEAALYAEKTYLIIQDLLEQQYDFKDICILVRKQKEGTAVASYLTDKGLPITSSETLLLKNDPNITGLVAMLQWIIDEDNLIAKIDFLYFLSTILKIHEKHFFLEKLRSLSPKEITLKLFKDHQLNIDFEQMMSLSLYEALEYGISVLKLAFETPAYLQSFLNEAFNFSQKKESGKAGFLDFWEQKKDKLSISVPEGYNAVQIMTIHKSKGLEFPCVIYPFANTDIYRELQPTLWIPVKSSIFESFTEVFIDFKKNLAYVNTDYKEIIEEYRSKLELDAFNLLYVALTRAEKQLYILSKLDISAKGALKDSRISGKLIKYLQDQNIWSPDQKEFTFGVKRGKSEEMFIENEVQQLQLEAFPTKAETYQLQISTQNGMIRDLKQEQAISFGTLMHHLLAEIYTPGDISCTIEKFRTAGLLSNEKSNHIANKINELVRHPQLSAYYAEGLTIFIEREFIFKGKLYRPDRVVINKKRQEAIIIDYKTGAKSKHNESQINTYAEVITDYGFEVVKNILIYLTDPIEIQYV